MHINTDEKRQMRMNALDRSRLKYLQKRYRESGDHKWVRVAAMEGYDLDWASSDDEWAEPNNK